MAIHHQNNKIFHQNNKMLVTSWTPKKYSGLLFWSNTDTKNIDTNNTTIGSWKDMSGNNNHAYQNSNGFKPVLIKSALNGYDSIFFQWNKFLKINLTLDYYTIIMAIQGINSSMIYEFGNDASNTTGFYLNSSAPSIATTVNGFTGTATVKSNTPGWLMGIGPKIVSHAYGGTHSTHKLYINQNNIALTNDYTDNPGALGLTQTLNIGAKYDGSNGMNGFLTELIIYNRVLTQAEHLDIVTKLKSKYNLT